jgi:hypothetical protein
LDAITQVNKTQELKHGFSEKRISLFCFAGRKDEEEVVLRGYTNDIKKINH